jgi:hypothetical protein
MPTFEDPAADAAEAQQALRGLAHATRSIEHPRQIYEILGSLSAATASLAQSLNQTASFHDTPARETAWTGGESRVGRAAAFQVSWELHRAGEVLKHVTEAIDHAHEAEATICYDPHDFPGLVDALQVQRHNRDQGLGL